MAAFNHKVDPFTVHCQPSLLFSAVVIDVRVLVVVVRIKCN